MAHDIMLETKDAVAIKQVVYGIQKAAALNMGYAQSWGALVCGWVIQGREHAINPWVEM